MRRENGGGDLNSGKTSTCDAYCKGCGHYRGGNGLYICEYLLDEGRKRPCKPGKGCTCHTKFGGAKKRPYVNPMAPKRRVESKPRKRKIEPKLARELFEAGKTDEEIAAAFCAAKVTVRKWRAENGLKRKKKG